jgi:hypothetical protein
MEWMWWLACAKMAKQTRYLFRTETVILLNGTPTVVLISNSLKIAKLRRLIRQLVSVETTAISFSYRLNTSSIQVQIWTLQTELYQRMGHKCASHIACRTLSQICYQILNISNLSFSTVKSPQRRQFHTLQVNTHMYKLSFRRMR